MIDCKAPSASLQSGTLVNRVAASQRCCQFGLLIDVPVPRQQQGGRKVVDNARVTLLTVLVAPVGVIVTVVGQPIHFVGSGTLSCTFRGVTPSHQ